MTRDTQTNLYGSIAAEIYDIDKPDFALPDTTFYLERFRGFGAPILEPACGSGRTLMPFLQAGLDMTGFDPSPEMLARCRTRCDEAGFAPDLAGWSFDDFVYSRRFGAIVIPVSSFTLIADFAGALAALRRLHDHLEPGGVLMLDIQGLASLPPPGEDRRRWKAPSGDLLTLEGVRSRTDWFRQRAESTYRYERWRDHRLVETQIDIMAQRFWGLDEFRMTLETAGFSDISVVGNYDRSRGVRGRDRTWTFEARKA